MFLQTILSFIFHFFVFVDSGRHDMPLPLSSLVSAEASHAAEQTAM